MQVARDLEQSAVVALEVDRHHGRAGLRDQPRGEAPPGRVHRPAERLQRRRDRAAGEDADAPAAREDLKRRLARGEVDGLRLARLVEADRQDDAVERLGLAKHPVREDAEVAAGARQDMPEHQPVEDAVGMVRDHDQRARRRDVLEGAAHHLERDAVAFDHHLPEVASRRHLAVVVARHADQLQPAGQVLDRPDHHAAGAGARGTGVADLAGDAGGKLHGRAEVCAARRAGVRPASAGCHLSAAL